MFTEQTNKPFVHVIKTYLRLKDKKSFPLMLKLPIVAGDLKELVVAKTKIPNEDLIIMIQGKPIDFRNQSDILHLKDKSILHVINKKYLRNDILELQIRLILRNEEKSCLGEITLVAKADQCILQFVEDKLLPVIEERAGQKLSSDCVNLVSNGTVLNKHLKFNHYLIQNGAEIICMINFIEELQSSVKNISTHKFIGAHRQMKLYQSLNFQSGEKGDTMTKKRQDKLKTNPQQHPQYKSKQTQKIQNQHKKIKPEKKKYYQTKQKQKFSPTLSPEFSDLLHKDIANGYSDQEPPQSPIAIEYPKIQHKSQTNVQWYDQKLEGENQMPSQDFRLQETQKQQEKTEKLQSTNVQKEDSKKTQQKSQLVQQRSQLCKILLGDFLMMNPTKSISKTKTKNEFLGEMSEKVHNFLKKSYEGSKVSQIRMEFPQLEKRIPVKPGDFIICKDIIKNSSKSINQRLFQRFNNLIKQKTSKKIQEDHDLEQRLRKEKVKQQTRKTEQITSI